MAAQGEGLGGQTNFQAPRHTNGWEKTLPVRKPKLRTRKDGSTYFILVGSFYPGKSGKAKEVTSQDNVWRCHKGDSWFAYDTEEEANADALVCALLYLFLFFYELD